MLSPMDTHTSDRLEPSADVPEMAAALRISVRRARRLLCAGLIPGATHVGREWRIPRRHLRALVEGGTPTPGQGG